MRISDFRDGVGYQDKRFGGLLDLQCRLLCVEVQKIDELIKGWGALKEREEWALEDIKRRRSIRPRLFLEEKRKEAWEASFSRNEASLLKVLEPKHIADKPKTKEYAAHNMK